jgi:hypothetical protein
MSASRPSSRQSLFSSLFHQLHGAAEHFQDQGVAGARYHGAGWAFAPEQFPSEHRRAESTLQQVGSIPVNATIES